MSSEKRPVWLNEDTASTAVSLLRSINLTYADDIADKLEDAWKTAPADAAREAVREALLSGLDPEDRKHVFGEAADKEVASVLRALGMPGA